ncbi:hypothetical protein P389DRAFT_98841 [Cystobasidium minutum MCA 4210]|uniref:uncharacterized protein n=1 Tax=Cystobasidium minutum MCA 4210 TaxID=1397322 RepID=UPI0034D00E73|eukprot:jgi/Rhomi1/98841/CE98840_567
MYCQQLPHRFWDQLVTHLNAVHNAVTAGGTLPALPLPSLSSLGIGNQEKRLPPPPPVPPTCWEQVVKHVKRRPYTYSLLGGVSLTAVGTMIAVHLSPAFRARLFGAFPLLKPIYLNQRRALPATPRPRVSPDGKHRLEAVLVLGCEPGSYGREVAKAFERHGFIVIASVSNTSEVDELEFSGNGFIKAIVLDSASSPTTQVSQFCRALNTALSLRYPLRSAGDPFHYISSSSPGIQLTSVINCLALSNTDGLALPLEALPSDAISSTLESAVTIPMLLLQSILPILRVAHDPHGLPATVVTCFKATDRYIGTPFTGSTSAVPGLASNALASALDVLRRELELTESRSRRKIKIVNLDVGFLQPVNTRKTHRGVSHLPESRQSAGSQQNAEANLPAHIRELYAPALLANFDTKARSSRHRMPDASVLSHKLLGIVLAKKARHIPDRTSVGVGVRSYYLASLLPTSFIDMFFSFRQRLLSNVSARNQADGQALGKFTGNKKERRPLPLPGAAASSSSDRSSKAEEARNESYSVDNEETVLPPYAPFDEGSEHSSASHSQAASPIDPESSMYSGRSMPSSTSNSAFLGDSFVQV